MPENPPQIFIAHASEDKPLVRELYAKLLKAGYKPWLDEEDLLPGQIWREEIPKALKNSDLFIACLSSTSISKRGYIQREFKMAMEMLAELPPGEIYLIPLKFDDCEIPELRQTEYGLNLKDIQWLDYWKPNGFEKLVKSIEHQFGSQGTDDQQDKKSLIRELKNKALQAENTNLEFAVSLWKEILAYDPLHLDVNAAINRIKNQQKQSQFQKKVKPWFQLFDYEVITVNKEGEQNQLDIYQASYFTEDSLNDFSLEMVAIFGGKFLMGSTREEGTEEDEHPKHKVTISPFFIGKFLITQKQWQIITNLPKVERKLKDYPSHFHGENRPVENISWYEADEFCKRLSKTTERNYRLPSEAEWEYACRAGTITPFHYGETLTAKLANYDATEIYADETQGNYRGDTTSVGSFSPNAFGLYDMHGNVREWCADYWHKNYEYSPKDGSIWKSNKDEDFRVVRGGAWMDSPRCCRSAFRGKNLPIYSAHNIGFRVVCSVIL